MKPLYRSLLILSFGLSSNLLLADNNDPAASELLRAQQSHDQALRDYGKAKDDASWTDKQVKEAEQDLQKAQQRLEQLIQKRDQARADIVTTQARLEAAREKVDAAWANRPQ